MAGSAWSDRFESATIVLPVVTETASLDQTVKVVLRDVRAELKGLLIVVCQRTTDAAMSTVERIKAQ